MKILITGGAGFIGSHLSDTLLAAGHEITIIDNLSSGTKKFLPKDAEFIEMDIRDEKISDILKKGTSISFTMKRPKPWFPLPLNAPTWMRT